MIEIINYVKFSEFGNIRKTNLSICYNVKFSPQPGKEAPIQLDNFKQHAD